MEYLLLIYANENATPHSDSSEFKDMVAAYRSFSQKVEDDGVLLGANPLQSIETATTVRVRNGKADATDGPFAETKEQLAGYYLLNCKDLDEAMSYAAQIPGAQYGSVEVRPIMKLGPCSEG